MISKSIVKHWMQFELNVVSYDSLSNRLFSLAALLIISVIDTFLLFSLMLLRHDNIYSCIPITCEI